MEAIVVLVLGFAAAHPIVTTILMILGICRLVLKPIFAIAHAIAEAIPGDSQEKAVDAVETSAIMKGVFFVLDYLFSIKLIK